jgi:pyruvate/2-oxoglutarate dehydrogenase complex dihydrolipoamide dehydrogenase (E3) component
MSERFDAIIVGAGQAGPALAGRLAAAGCTVAVVERHLVGGTCVNTGCTPTKTLIASAHAAHLVRRAGDFGLRLGGPVSVNMAEVKARADAVSARSRQGLESWLEGLEGCSLIRGHARFEGPKALRVGDRQITAGQIFLNVGGRASIPDMPGINDVEVLTNSSLLALGRLPRHLVVVGGSYIGLEFAQMYRRFGAEVTVIEKGPRLIAHEDSDVSDAVREILEAEGIRFRLNAECIRFAPLAEGMAVGVACTTGAPEVFGSHVLLAVGRRPNTDDLGLDRAGVEMDARGFIHVDDGLATSVPGIWALGDCNGRGAFTHTAYNDYEIVAANLLESRHRSAADRIPTYALYTDPPLGRVGMNKTTAARQGRRILVGRRPMTRVARAVEKGEAQGFMEIIADAESGAVLGGTVLGPGGDEAIHAITQLMAVGGTAAQLRDSMHIHPTVSELLPTIAGELRPLDDPKG